MTTLLTESPSIWVGCWAAYNNGHLHGKWIDATTGIDQVRQDVKDMLKNSPESDAEEWGIFDCSGFYSYHVSENPDLEELCEVAELIKEHGEVYASLLQEFGIDGAKEMMEDNYRGEYANDLEFAYAYVEDTGMLDKVDETLQRYFDYESFSRDLSYDFHTVETKTGTHYFWNS